MSFAGVWGAALFLALVSSIVSLWMHFRNGSIHELASQVRQQTIDITELYDAVEKWTNREKVRNLRAGKLAAQQQPLTPQRGTPEYKAYLRAIKAGTLVQ